MISPLPTAANTGDSPSFPERGGRQSYSNTPAVAHTAED